MALFYECMERCAHIVLDIADIVRDGDFSPTRERSIWIQRAFQLLKPILASR